MNFPGRLRWARWLLLVAAAACGRSAAAAERPHAVTAGEEGTLVYDADERGNRVPDFSHCGYAGASAPIPDVPVRIVVAPSGDGDDGARIQAALDRAGELAPDRESGFRGAVLLLPGRFAVRGQLRIPSSGVVLRGSGSGPGGTCIVAAGQDRRPLVWVAGASAARQVSADARAVVSPYVPVGARRFELDATAGLEPGTRVFVDRPSTEAWIRALGMDAFGIGWKPGSRDLRWDRTVVAFEGRTVTLDAPITTALDERYGGGTVRAYSWPDRLERVGIENLGLESGSDPRAPRGEDHSWVGAGFENVRDAWVRRVVFRGFAGSAVTLWESASRVTVEDCRSLDPVSEIGGGRRQTFFTAGQQTLFLRCLSEQGRRDFAVGHCAAGPNAFVACAARNALGPSGPVGSWASGVLYDNVRIDGGGLYLENRWAHGQGAGWSAANCVLWQSTAAEMRCFAPPTAANLAAGVWSTFLGDARWEARNEFVTPRSLFLAQLAERLGDAAVEAMGPIVGYPPGSTSPSLEAAAAMAARSSRPAPRLEELIDQASARAPLTTDAEGVPRVEEWLGAGEEPPAAPAAPRSRLSVRNGWLVVGDALKTGSTMGTVWWRGTVRPADAPSFGPALTRFVPGRPGLGFTDDLGEVAGFMAAEGMAAFEHHYGLWYDRRRDDHERVRRLDGEVWPPFYEQPFTRSGEGVAWDGLSRYDLTRYNPWYWSRLAEFATHCDRRGLVLIHQHYFQHNLLEAGAHWADFPWRSANNVNQTGFPEPPPYAGDKRIFQDHLFYDVSDPVRRPLHRAYIRQCLENFLGTANVIQMTSAEFTGPLAFLRFWIDTVREWEEETGVDALVGLSATRDVQDAVLEDPERRPAVSVIDIRYWWYQADGRLYAPEGGKHLSPRQHARVLRPRESSFEQVLRAVREYRERYPSIAVVYSGRGSRHAWAVLFGGGSLPRLSALEAALCRAIPRMRPRDDLARGALRWCLADPGAGYLVCAGSPGPIELDLRGDDGTFVVRWLDPSSGATLPLDAQTVEAGRVVSFEGPEGERRVAWLSRRGPAPPRSD